MENRIPAAKKKGGFTPLRVSEELLADAGRLENKGVRKYEAVDSIK